MKRSICWIMVILMVSMALAAGCSTAPQATTPTTQKTESAPVAEGAKPEAAAAPEAAKTEKDTVTYVVPRSVEVVEDAYIWVAEKMGYFDELNIEPVVMPSYGTSDTKMVVAGKADVCLPSPYVGMQAVDGGVDIVYVYQMMQKYHFGFCVNPNKGITSIEQLAGKKIVLGDAGWSMIADPILYAYGVDPKSVEYVVAADNRAQVAWAGVDADAVLTWYMEFEEWQSAGMAFDYLDCEEKFVGAANGMAVSRKALEDPVFRDKITRFLTGVAMGSYFVSLNPEAAAEIVLEKFPQITTSYEVTTDILTSFGEICVTHPDAVANGLGSFKLEKWQNMRDIGVALGQISDKVDASKMFDDSLVATYNDFDHARVEKDAAEYVLGEH